MKKVIAAALAAGAALALTSAAPANAEPLECRVVNGAWTKVTGDENPFMYCIDDPQPSILDIGGGS